MNAQALVRIERQEIAGVQQDTVDARELHWNLEVGRDFSTWVKGRIEEFGFIEGEDFSPILGKTSEQGGRPATDYILSLDMAKELAMVERTEKGREVRRYFIRCEQKLREIAATGITPAMEALAYRMADYALKEELSKNKRFTAKTYRRMLFYRHDKKLSLTDTAKLIGVGRGTVEYFDKFHELFARNLLQSETIAPALPQGGAR